MTTIWGMIAVLTGILELFTNSLMSFPITLGAIGALIISLFFNNIVVEILVFIIITSIFYLLVFKLLKSKKFYKNAKASNAESLIGKDAKVVDVMDDNMYIVKVLNEKWSAISIDGTKFEKGDTAKVISLEGVKLIIEK